MRDALPAVRKWLEVPAEAAAPVNVKVPALIASPVPAD
jgi:hypothetical protein